MASCHPPGGSSVTRKTGLTVPVLSLAVAATALTSGCASIVHGGPRSVPVASNPPGATVSIYGRDGKAVVVIAKSQATENELAAMQLVTPEG